MCASARLAWGDSSSTRVQLGLTMRVSYMSAHKGKYGESWLCRLSQGLRIVLKAIKTLRINSELL